MQAPLICQKTGRYIKRRNGYKKYKNGTVCNSLILLMFNHWKEQKPKNWE